MKKAIRRLAVLTVIFAMLFTGTAYAGFNNKKPVQHYEFYGNVYIFHENAPLIWDFMRSFQMDEEYAFYEMMNLQPVALINKGEILQIRIAVPLKYCVIQIYYEGKSHFFRLHPRLLGRNFIMFTFEGG